MARHLANEYYLSFDAFKVRNVSFFLSSSGFVEVGILSVFSYESSFFLRACHLLLSFLQ